MLKKVTYLIFVSIDQILEIKSMFGELCGNGNLIGPFFYDENITGLVYMNMIQEQVFPELDQIYDRRNSF